MDVDVDAITQLMNQLSFLLSNYVHEDVYNMNEIRFYFKAHPKKRLTQGKAKGWKLQKEHVILTRFVKATRTDKLKLLVIYNSNNHNVLEGGNFMSMFGGTQIK